MSVLRFTLVTDQCVYNKMTLINQPSHCCNEKCLNHSNIFHLINVEREAGHEYKKTGSEIGKALAEKSRGLFSADDWMCKA